MTYVTRLLFNHDGRLSAQARVLSRLIEAADGTSARLLAGEDGKESREIVPCAASGWAFDLREDDGSSGGGFRPFRLRRGGRLRVGAAAVSLHGRPSSHVGWSFSTPAGRRIDATVATDATAAGDELDLLVELQTQEPLDAMLELADVLALGCWLIVRWHSAPSTDHLLSAAAPSLALASGSWQAAVAGIS